MKIRNIDKALFTGVFVGIIIFVKEFFFSDINSFLSIIIGPLAAIISYLVGDKFLTKDEIKN
ncbi:hypothetical protein [Aquibacillus rhizosphaerae]|uniref:Uncharacterized protein n=1 Tax=Aquibacillus rhizosphaerae TaxID=3051431 RepID=A0ABT7L2S4_9BACI|nr:hypothetical protein [Aquibacillus sp. LR5S19]MDL4839480.1 hypothetical protein [Aquibacillus sp. LR5S19]